VIGEMTGGPQRLGLQRRRRSRAMKILCTTPSGIPMNAC
jgi:hypothetical protein